MIKVTLVDKMGTDRTVVNSARISFGQNKDALDDKDVKLIKYLADNDHLSPFEHASLSVLVECPLFVRSQIHRHRTFAYNEISRRYTAENLEFYVPPLDDIRTQSKSNRQASDAPLSEAAARAAQTLIELSNATALQNFNSLILAGVAREQARMVLPQNLMTRFYMTGSVRNWAHFLALRLDAHAQNEVQYVALQVKTIMEKEFPVATAALFATKDPTDSSSSGSSSKRAGHRSLTSYRPRAPD